MAEGDESRLTVLVAGGANLAIALAKGVAGVLSGSSAMLAEAAHSVADTLNQGFLLTALQRSRRPPDRRQPFGYGRERYFWSLLAAVGIFVLGAGFSFLEGVEAIIAGAELVALPLTFGVLGVSFVLEGTSWVRAVRQVRREGAEHGHSLREELETTPDPTIRTVVFEDSAAMIGLVLAAIGVTLHALTGNAIWDGLASILIGLLLVVVAYLLGRQSKEMLLGPAADQETIDDISRTIDDVPGIDRVLEVLTMQLGPNELLVASRVDLVDDVNGQRIEQVADEVDKRLREGFPEVRHVFVDPTPSGAT